MFNMDCFRPVGLYSDRVHIIWIAFIALTDKLYNSSPSVYKNCLEKQCPHTQVSMVNSMP